MEEQQYYTVKTPWGYQYKIIDLTLGKAHELIRQQGGQELERLSKKRTHGGVFLLDTGAVITTSYADATLYESLKAYLSNLYTSGMLVRKQIPEKFPVQQIEFALDGRKICYHNIAPDEGEVLEAVSEKISISKSSQNSFFRTPEGELVCKQGESFFLYQSEKDYFDLEEKYAFLESVFRQISNEEAVASRMIGRNPYGEYFPEKVEMLISTLPDLLFVPKAVFDHSIKSLSKIEKYIYRQLLTADFSERLFLPLLAYIGNVHILNEGSEWIVKRDITFNVWTPNIRTKEGVVKKLYLPLLNLLDPKNDQWYPLTGVLNM
ncbi:MAG: hypothetical protein CV087_23955 [Candidatus Brocadia sp. WS118]|nr:MAG: hypothetical protein CV087_23955 [Candidatus Brocadia sp. WS118]